MGHAAGKLPDGLHLLGLDQGVLRLGEVAGPLLHPPFKRLVHGLESIPEPSLSDDAPLDVTREAEGERGEADREHRDEESGPGLGLQQVRTDGVDLQRPEQQRCDHDGRQEDTRDLAAAEYGRDPRPVRPGEQHPGRQQAQGQGAEQRHARERAALMEGADPVDVAQAADGGGDEGEGSRRHAEAGECPASRVAEDDTGRGPQDAGHGRERHPVVRPERA